MILPLKSSQSGREDHTWTQVITIQGTWAIKCFWNSEGRIPVEDWVGLALPGKGRVRCSWQRDDLDGVHRGRSDLK